MAEKCSQNWFSQHSLRGFSAASAVKCLHCFFGFVHRGVLIVIHHPLNAVLQRDHVEVNKKSDLQIEQPQIREELCLIEGMKGFLALDLHHDFPTNDQVGPKPALTYGSTARPFALAHSGRVAPAHRPGKPRMQTGAAQVCDGPMDLDCGSNDLFGSV